VSQVLRILYGAIQYGARKARSDAHIIIPVVPCISADIEPGPAKDRTGGGGAFTGMRTAMSAAKVGVPINAAMTAIPILFMVTPTERWLTFYQEITPPGVATAPQ
jgi:hypothetical protein